MYLLLIDSLSISGKSYPLSRHRFCFFNGFSTTTLSSVSVAAFMSCVFAAVMTQQILECQVGLSVHDALFLFYPCLLDLNLSCPPKGALIDTLSSDCHINLMPLRSS